MLEDWVGAKITATYSHRYGRKWALGRVPWFGAN